MEFFHYKDFYQIRSDRSEGELPFSGLVGIEYLLGYRNSRKGRSPEVTIDCKISIVIIPKNSILCLSDPLDLLILENWIG